MEENELRKKFRKEMPMLLEWGRYINDEVEKEFKKRNGFSLRTILKIEVKPRIKKEDALVEKAFYRDKNYKNPYNDITDKVGIRFVVLLSNQILDIKKIIEDNLTWYFSKDVDYEEMTDENPELFIYESVHYIVKNKKEIEQCGILIAEGTSCEVQIRTLLQHAYAELSHDYVYKKDINVSNVIRRNLSKSMALIEVADSLFKEVSDVLVEEELSYNKYISMANKCCEFSNFTDKINRCIYDSYRVFLENQKIDIEDINVFIKSKNYLNKKILEKQSYNILYRQPIILMLYYLIVIYTNQMIELWPFDEEMIRPLFTDLGISLEN